MRTGTWESTTTGARWARASCSTCRRRWCCWGLVLFPADDCVAVGGLCGVAAVQHLRSDLHVYQLRGLVDADVLVGDLVDLFVCGAVQRVAGRPRRRRVDPDFVVEPVVFVAGGTTRRWCWGIWRGTWCCRHLC